MSYNHGSDGQWLDDNYEMVTIHHTCGHTSVKRVNMSGTPGEDVAEWQDQPCQDCENDAKAPCDMDIPQDELIIRALGKI